MHSLTSWRLVPARGAVAGSLASGLLGQLMLLVSGILVARTLGPTDRGYLALLVLLPAVLQHIGTLGLPLATTYFIARDEADEAAVRRNIARRGRAGDRPRPLQAGLLVLLLEGDPDRVKKAAIVSLALLPGALADMYGKALLQGQGRYGAFNTLRNATIFFYLAGIAVLLAFGVADIVGFAIAWVVANALSGAVTMAVALHGRPRTAGTTSRLPQADAQVRDPRAPRIAFARCDVPARPGSGRAVSVPGVSACTWPALRSRTSRP